MVARSAGARRWALLLSELAAVPVTVEWERPAWRVRWVDGPTRDVLMQRAHALGPYRVGSPLPVEQLRFARSSSAEAVALAWLAHGSDTSRDAAVMVEHACEEIGYPQLRADAATSAAADLLLRVGRGDSTQIGALLASAHPPVRPRPLPRPAPDLAGRIRSITWPSGGPPAELLGPSPQPTTITLTDPVDRPTAPAAQSGQRRPQLPRVRCARCGKPLSTAGRGRPALYCSGACRTAAHRAAHR